MKRRSQIEHHGHANDGKISPEYKVWMGIKKRCYNQNEANYSLYGGRGIVVCDHWRDSFINFFNDMGKRPSPSHSIERTDNDGNYTPENCRWATRKEQARNRKTTRLVVFCGKEMSLAEACEKTGTNYDAAKHRINRGLQFDKAVRRNARDYGASNG